MIPPEKSYQEPLCGPQEAKTFRNVVTQFILREFPRLGGPWVVGHFVDKLLALFEEHHLRRDRVQPGQTTWMAVAVDETAGYRKPMSKTRQVPVIPTLIHPSGIASFRQDTPRHEVLRHAIARAEEPYTIWAGASLTSASSATRLLWKASPPTSSPRRPTTHACPWTTTCWTLPEFTKKGGGCPGLWPGMNPPRLRSCDQMNHEIDYWHDSQANEPYSLR